MQTWKKKLLGFAIKLDDVADQWSFHLKKRLGTSDPLQVIAYRSYGTAGRIYVRGRVLEDKKIAFSAKTDSKLANLINIYKRLETDEVPGATVMLELQNDEYTAVTDKEGYFIFNLLPAAPLKTEELYLTLPLKLINAPYQFEPVETVAEIMIPPAGAEYGIISDIDDTIIRTQASSFLAMGKTVLFGNARTRLPFAGVTEFYKALQLGRNGKRNNPFFYVSSSPWNLYDLLVDFMDHNEIPAGPLLLRDFGLQSETFMSGGHLGHKFKEIAQILDTYPQLNFILVGDSGQEDPPIYQEVVNQYPGRIISIYIRDVAKGKKRQVAEKIATTLKQQGVDLVLTEHTVKAAEHAAAKGLIFTENLPIIEQDKKQDKGQEAGKIDAV